MVTCVDGLWIALRMSVSKREVVVNLCIVRIVFEGLLKHRGCFRETTQLRQRITERLIRIDVVLLHLQSLLIGVDSILKAALIEIHIAKTELCACIVRILFSGEFVVQFGFGVARSGSAASRIG